MKSILIIQARMGSTRLPGKSLMKVGSKFLVDHVVERCLNVKGIDRIYLATTSLKEDDILVEHIKKKYQIKIYRGSKFDVRSRFLDIIEYEKPDYVVRITGDDPFKDPAQISAGLDYLKKEKFDYVCNFQPRTLPIGMDYEVFTVDSLLKSVNQSSDLNDMEHVTWSMRSKKYNWVSINQSEFYPETRLTIDTKSDLIFCGQIAKILEKNFLNFSSESTKIALIEYEKERL
jgi:spore coat polysaccharide biosynthesis protein SpsF (cytidylyltransferase family)